MKNSFILIGLLLCTNLAISQEYAENRLIAKYKLSESQQKSTGLQAVLTALGHLKTTTLTKSKTATKSKAPSNEIILYHFKEAIDVPAAITALKKTGLFAYVEPDFIGYGAGQKHQEFTIPTTIPNDTHYNRQWGLKNDGSFSLSSATAGADVDMELAWDITTGNADITVAILDSGVLLSHPEFSGRIWTNTAETANSLDSDNNGYTDDIHGWDFANGNNDPTDDQGHGTNVAGIALANGNNNNGYAGVDWKSKLMPLKILDNNNSGFYSWWIAAIDYAVNNGAKVINMSVGGSGFSMAMKDAVNRAYNANVVITVSMMNFNNDVPYYPAAYDSTIAVGSSNPNDQRTNPFFWSASSGSNYGNHIDVIAPGNFIYGLSHTSTSYYGSYWGGTSQAAPLVAGICALMLDQRPTLTVAQIRSILRDTSEDQVGLSSEDTEGWDKYYGAGRVNAHRALQNVLSVQKNTNGPSFSLYPNPTNNTIYFTGEISNYSYAIFNILGKRISNGILSEKKLDIANLTPGIYSFQLQNEKGMTTKKFIKK